MKMWMDPAACRGCLRCELACSFHHSGHTAFNPELSSTRVFRSNDTKAIRMALNDSCDHCDNENFPMCVKACVFGARGIAKEAMK